MIQINEIQRKLKELEAGFFQKICNEILPKMGYKIYKFTGSKLGTNKTIKGTPDSVYYDVNKKDKYVYIEITTQQEKTEEKVLGDVQKCLNKINSKPELKGKITKIIFMHNNSNVEESVTEKARELCGEIQFEIYGIEFIADFLQKEKEILRFELGMNDEHDLINAVQTAISKIDDERKSGSKVSMIEKQVNDLFISAAEIINNVESGLRISSGNVEKLREIFSKLDAFSFNYNEENDESKEYYYNLLVILSRIDMQKAITFFDNIPKHIKEENAVLNLIAKIYIEKQRFDEAKEILENLYFNNKYDDALMPLAETYYLCGNFDSIISLLSSLSSLKFDKYGYLASLLLLSKNEKKKFSKREILQLNNGKFNKMPLYYACTSEMLYRIDSKDKKYREQFCKGIKYLAETNIVAILIMTDHARKIDLEDEIIKYYCTINLSPILNNIALDLVSKKIHLSKKDEELFLKITPDSLDNESDKNYFFARRFEILGREIESLEYYKKSFMSKGNISSGISYIRLSMKNNSIIDLSVLQDMMKNNYLEVLVTIAKAYDFLGMKKEAVNAIYKSLYLANNSKYLPMYAVCFGKCLQ